MKKKFLSTAVVAFAVMALASCSSIRHTSTTVDVNTQITNTSTADLRVAPQKISFTYVPKAPVRRTGEKNVIKTAVAEALKANGNADVLVGFQYEIKKSRNFFGHTSIKYVTVEGYPATYVNFQTAK
ncbi:MAG: hypothetical protein NC338_08030 [Firmicutes bacterium]|nr:hypothetical protein [Bacillota bacterium]MCM1401967.1 hypothetical protein [Bacteroides sp.]MCM1477803.1 hypothetical protein [Bacteroides sp.]